MFIWVISAVALLITSPYSVCKGGVIANPLHTAFINPVRRVLHLVRALALLLFKQIFIASTMFIEIQLELIE
ncbi:hypothetical protein FACS18949_12980 [Clostridia bacterium]|nr:hypothetical protein FACS18949_12980 [Clostridia bacterium]